MLFGQIEAFLEVAKAGNVSRAAEALYVTQPALTARIQALEKELGETLFVRTGRGVRLTDAGRAFLPCAERVVQAIEDGRQALTDLRSASAGRLMLGAAPAVSTYVLPPVLKRFTALHPRVDVAVRTGHSEEILAMVLNDEVQIGLVRSLRHPDIEAMSLYQDELVLVSSPQHRFARRGTVDLAEVGRERLVMFDRTSSYFELTQSLFLRGGVVARTVMELDNIEAAKKMVEEGLGVALLPKVSVAREVASGLLSEIEIADAPPIRRSIEAIRRKDAGLPGGVVKAFLGELEATLRFREQRAAQLVV
jgi:DNA-binding transcriptional LysR family regulator